MELEFILELAKFSTHPDELKHIPGWVWIRIETQCSALYNEAIMIISNWITFGTIFIMLAPNCNNIMCTETD